MSFYFKLPVAFSEAAREIAVVWDEESSRRQRPMTTAMREDIILRTAAWAAANQGCGPCVEFDCYVVPRDGQATDPERMGMAISLAPSGDYLRIQLAGESREEKLPGLSLCNLVQRQAA